ncbi:hypothetical protein HY633_05010 [Candidatus Uhrbacteria bacterium]|nr:hypothetical protein [Candidatus Uhrbacteria bacterium]
MARSLAFSVMHEGAILDTQFNLEMFEKIPKVIASVGKGNDLAVTFVLNGESPPFAWLYSLDVHLDSADGGRRSADIIEIRPSSDAAGLVVVMGNITPTLGQEIALMTLEGPDGVSFSHYCLTIDETAQTH